MHRVRSGSKWGFTLACVVVLMFIGVGLAQENRASPIQHGAQPNPGEVRPPSADGNISSPSAGTLMVEKTPDGLWGLPAYAVGAIGIVIVVLVALAVSARRSQIQRQRPVR